MTEIHIIVLALIQGITEFLPISSSGHLVLVPLLSGWPDQGLMMDVAVHVGTLGAVLLYFWRDIFHMIRGLFRIMKGKRDTSARLVGLLFIASLPVVIAGFLMNMYIGDILRSMEVIGWTTLGFGILLYLSDKIGLTIRRIEHIGFIDAFLIGLAQCLALIPGTSRSGITITAARFLGMERLDAARFAMLLSIPAILGAGVLKGYELYELGNIELTHQIFTAAALAFVSAFFAIVIMMAWLKRATYTPFVLYRVLLGSGLLIYVYWF